MTGITVISSTQRIVMDPASSAIAVVSAGPIGPPGPAYLPPVWELFAEYTSPGTTNGIVLPSDTIEAEFHIVGPGCGGGSGRRGLTSEIRCGGGSGAPGTTLIMPIRGSVLDETFSVVVASGTVGGASVTADNTNGNSSTAPLPCTVTGSISGIVGYAWPSFIGTSLGGGLGVAGAAASGRTGMEGVLSGIASSATGLVGPSNSWHSNRAATGGGAGGGLTAANVASNGGNSAYVFSRNKVTAGAAVNANGAAGWSPTLNDRLAGAVGGGGGAGGGSSAAGPGGAGGNGGYPGGGGGGGGASSNGQASGAGGNGANGYVGIWILRQSA